MLELVLGLRFLWMSKFRSTRIEGLLERTFTVWFAYFFPLV